MSQNDPRGGNKGDGPPDLEEVWRDLNRRLNSIFGRKQPKRDDFSGGGDRPPSGPPRTGRLLGGGLGLVVGLFVILWFASGFYVVDASEKAVILQFGQFKEVKDNGLHWRYPYPIQTDEKVNVTQVRTVEVGYRGSEGGSENLSEALMLTDDENIVNIQFAVQYTIADPKAFLFNNRDTENAVKQAGETAMREKVGRKKMNSVLYEDREELANDTMLLTQEILDRYATGIKINRVTLRNAQPPQQVQEAFNDAVKASQDLERFRNEGQAYANDVQGKIQGVVSRLQAEAAGYQSQVVSHAQGDASRFKQIYAEYAKAPEVTRNRMYLDTMQEIFTQTSKVMVDTHGNGNLLYLPLDKLMQQTGSTLMGDPSSLPSVAKPAALTSVPATSVPAAASAAAVDYRNRDALRTIERGNH